MDLKVLYFDFNAKVEKPNNDIIVEHNDNYKKYYEDKDDVSKLSNP